MAKKNPHAMALGKLGGRARARNLSKEERQQIAKEGGIKGGKARAAALHRKDGRRLPAKRPPRGGRKQENLGTKNG
jgi:hypothetical protein